MHKFLAGAVLSLILLVPSMTFAQSTNPTQAQLQAQIAQLLAIVAQLQAQLSHQVAGSSTIIPVPVLGSSALSVTGSTTPITGSTTPVTGSTTPIVSISGVTAGQTYAIGSTLSGSIHVSNGVPGERICLSLTTNDLQLFTFPVDHSCTLAINNQGQASFSGTVASTLAYTLIPGSYHLRAEVYAANAWSGGYSLPLAIGESASFNIVNPSAALLAISSISPTSGTTGSRITVSGTNLSGFTSIQFYRTNGELAATIPSTSLSLVSVSSNSISFTLSGGFVGIAGPDTYQVKVVTPTGTSNALSFTVTGPTIVPPPVLPPPVIPPVPPTSTPSGSITSFVVAPSTVSLGQNVNLSWNTMGASSCQIQTIVNGSVAGTKSVDVNSGDPLIMTPRNTLTYRLACAMQNGTLWTKDAPVTVVSPPTSASSTTSTAGRGSTILPISGANDLAASVADAAAALAALEAQVAAFLGR